MDDLRRQARDLFPSIYLTLVSMVQALALEDLLRLVYDLDAGALDGIALATRLGQFAAVFLGLLVVWHDYVLGVIRYRYVVGLQDSAIPFLLALGEFGLIEATRSARLDSWFLWWGPLLALGVWIYHHQYRRVRAEAGAAEADRRWGAFTLHQRTAFFVFGASWSLTAGAWLRAAPPAEGVAAGLVWLQAASIGGYAFATGWAWRKLVAADVAGDA